MKSASVDVGFVDAPPVAGADDVVAVACAALRVAPPSRAALTCLALVSVVSSSTSNDTPRCGTFCAASTAAVPAFFTTAVAVFLAASAARLATALATRRLTELAAARPAVRTSALLTRRVPTARNNCMAIAASGTAKIMVAASHYPAAAAMSGVYRDRSWACRTRSTCISYSAAARSRSLNCDANRL